MLRLVAHMIFLILMRLATRTVATSVEHLPDCPASGQTDCGALRTVNSWLNQRRF
jgi:hypothetical protein